MRSTCRSAELLPTLQIDDLSVTYPGSIAAVRGISLRVAPAECVGVVGESGSGKTQVVMAVMGLLPRAASTAGRVRFEGADLLGADPRTLNRVRGSRLTMIFQDPMTSLTPHLSVGMQLAETLVVHRGAAWSDAKVSALRMLEQVGIADAARRAGSYPHELSGGMRQRAMIGMSLLCEPSLLIADEPTTALDVTVQAQIIEILRTMRLKMNMAVVLISHDVGVVTELADRIVVMYAGRIVENAAATEVLRRPRHPYTAELLKCVPSLRAPRLGRMPSLPGQPFSPALAESGCSFAPRCPRVSARCGIERPLLAAIEGGGEVACHHPLLP